MFSDVGKLLVIAGLGLVLLGGVLWFAGKVPGVGRLPGDMSIEKETKHGQFRFYFPVVTCIVLSILLTLLLNLFLHLRH